jgi:hypothetical protein
LDGHMGVEQPLWFQFNAAIVEIVIGDFLFHPDDVAGEMHGKSHATFQEAWGGTPIKWGNCWP